MKALYKHITFAALALGVAACTQEDDFMASYQNDPNAVRITAQVGSDDVTGGFTRSNPLGTAEEQAKFNGGDVISVAAGTQAAVTYTLASDGTNWNPETGKYLKWEAETMDVTAYYPVTDGTSATTFSVPTDQTSEANVVNADYMTYTGEATKGTDNSINLAMERKMVRIVVDNITFNDQFETGYEVKDITVNANTTGYANGEVQAGDIEISAYKSDGKFYALLAPTKGEPNAHFLILTVTSNTGASGPHTLHVQGIPATTAGNSYNLSLTVGKNEASVTKVSVNEWEGGTIPDDEAIELKATCEISGTTATLTVPKNCPEASFTKALKTLSATDGVTVITINGSLTDTQQSALATERTSYTGGIIFNDMKLVDLSDGIKNLSNANVVDSEGQFTYVNKQSVTLQQYEQRELTAENQRGGYTFTGGSSTSHEFSSIIVKSGVHNITLQDCYLRGHGSPCLDIAPGATVYLTVVNTNIFALQTSYHMAAISVPVGATLVITAESTGTLTATTEGGVCAAIGGGLYSQMNESNTVYDYCGSGNIAINGGTIIATTTGESAGIGSAGYDNSSFPGGYSCGNITINGGNVTATGGPYAAGIGGGAYCPGGNITITGGTVTANGGVSSNGTYGGAGIGSGHGYGMTDFSYGTITITGGTVNATGGGSAAGIGHGTRVGEGGGSDAGGTIIIGAGATVTSNNETLSPTE